MASEIDGKIDLATLEAQASELIERALACGADACDVAVSRGHSLGVEVRDGAIENTSRSEGDDFSLRVFVGQRNASVGANHGADTRELAERAVAMARVSPEDPYQGLAVKGVAKSMGARAGWGQSGFVLATSDGFSGHYVGSRFSVSAAMVAGQGTGMERDYDFHSAVHAADLRDAATVGRSAGERVVRRLGPRQVASTSVPVVFDRRIASGLLGALMGAINGASIARKTSFLRGAMGKKVASADITVIDDPLRRRGLASTPFDGEGMAVAPIRFVENGILGQWVLDWATARELGLQSNGRAGRGGSGTSPTTTNCHIEAGRQTPEEMIASMKRGLLLTETIGHGVNMVTGDYSKGAAGFWIENGAIAYPVSEITVAGNLKDMFLSMTPASDLEFKGATNSPSLLVEGMTIGGA